MMNVRQLVDAVNLPAIEGELFSESEALRRRVVLNVNGCSADTNRREAIKRAVKAVNTILPFVLARAEDGEDADAGHGPGHWVRDYAHALRLASDGYAPIGAIVPAMIGGTLHDIGTLFMDRYAERTRAVRHAEVGALIVRAAAMESRAFASDEEADLAAYGIIAHTHYLKPQDVTCADEVVRTVRPYQDMVGDQPIVSVWLARWADRLDVNGPCFPARHYLTLERDHHDFGTDGFYKVSFADALEPRLRSNEEIKAAGGQRTMLEHLQMFAGSQTSASPYGKHDAGTMVALRDAYKESLEHVIWSVAHPHDVDVPRILKAWTIFLYTNIEPTRNGRMAAHNLDLGFRKLRPDIQRAWACGFRTIMTEYLSWADRMRAFLNELPADHLWMASSESDIRSVILPDRAWVELLAG